MAKFNDTGYGTIVAAEDVNKNIRLDIIGGIAGASDQDIGITTSFAATGEHASVSSINKQGSQKATLSGSVSAGDRVFTAAAGKVSTTAASGSFMRGIALEDGVDGQVIEIIPILAEIAEA